MLSGRPHISSLLNSCTVHSLCPFLFGGSHTLPQAFSPCGAHNVFQEELDELRRSQLYSNNFFKMVIYFSKSKCLARRDGLKSEGTWPTNVLTNFSEHCTSSTKTREFKAQSTSGSNSSGIQSPQGILGILML